jgi:purine-binding chemotaxis protein CheW
MSERARVVRRPTESLAPKAPKDTGPALREFLAFELGPARYALPLACIREIVRVPAVTEVPRGPREVLGVISVRGAVTTLIDLRRRLKLDETPLSSRTRILLVDKGDEILGLLVDGVLQVVRLRDDQVELSSVLGADAPPYLSGIGRPGALAHDTRKAGARGPESAEVMLLLDPSPLFRI